MKGLLRKDIYLAKDTLAIMLLLGLIIGVSLSFFVPSGVFIPLMTAMLASLTPTTMNLDHTSGWNRLQATMPLTKKTIVMGKYITFTAHILFGYIIGFILCFLMNLIRKNMTPDDYFTFSIIGLSFAFFSGCITLPANHIVKNEKMGIIIFIFSYFASAVILLGTGYLLLKVFLLNLQKDFYIIGWILLAFSLCLFCLSIIVSFKTYEKKELV